ncbi:MAG TPA: MBL fold metallo-hydrolase [Gemmatimonadaceae bacterium]|nr:MBL fold metallo-hydrolase [Gemmatimonadaceae bacterium]
MLEVTEHGDVRELRLTSRRSRLVGYGVSVFVTRDTLIDTGFPAAADELAAYLRAHPVAGAMLTHGHEDHSGGVSALLDLGVGVHCAAATDAWLRREERVGIYRRFTWGLRRRLRRSLRPFTPSALELRAAPGHSTDHHVVWDAERGTAFGGDLFIGVKLRIAHHDEDIRQQVAVLRDVASWQPERFFDAHRGLLPDAATQLRAKADWIEETIADIERRVHQGWSDAAIRDEVLGKEDATGRWSFGAYSRLNFVRNVRRTMR